MIACEGRPKRSIDILQQLIVRLSISFAVAFPARDRYRATRISMFTVRRLIALRPFAILTMLAMLCFATVAEAATCAPELEFSTALEAPVLISADFSNAGDEDQKGGTFSQQHGVCAHGHCHASANLTNSSSPNDSLQNVVLHGVMAAVRLDSLQRGMLSPPPRA